MLIEIKHMQQTSHPRNDNDARILHSDFEELKKLDSKQLQDWIYKIFKKTIKKIPPYFTSTTRCCEIEVDPG